MFVMLCYVISKSFSGTLPCAAWAELSQLWLLDSSNRYARRDVRYSKAFDNSFLWAVVRGMGHIFDRFDISLM